MVEDSPCELRDAHRTDEEPAGDGAAKEVPIADDKLPNGTKEVVPNAEEKLANAQQPLEVCSNYHMF